MKQRILKKIYKEGKYGKSYVCLEDIVFEVNKKGDIVPIGKLYKNKTHYTLNRKLCLVLKYKGKNLEVISNQVVPVEPASGIRAYLCGRITRKELGELFN